MNYDKILGEFGNGVRYAELIWKPQEEMREIELDRQDLHKSDERQLEQDLVAL